MLHSNSYEVWAKDEIQTYNKNQVLYIHFWTCYAVFVYFQEALDYKDYCVDRGATVVIRKPQSKSFSHSIYRGKEK